MERCLHFTGQFTDLYRKVKKDIYVKEPHSIFILNLIQIVSFLILVEYYF